MRPGGGGSPAWTVLIPRVRVHTHSEVVLCELLLNHGNNLLLWVM